MGRASVEGLSERLDKEFPDEQLNADIERYKAGLMADDLEKSRLRDKLADAYLERLQDLAFALEYERIDEVTDEEFDVILEVIGVELKLIEEIDNYFGWKPPKN
jgi:hypothetical protein